METQLLFIHVESKRRQNILKLQQKREVAVEKRIWQSKFKKIFQK